MTTNRPFYLWLQSSDLRTAKFAEFGVFLQREKDRLDGKKAKEEKDRLDGLIETYQENQQDHLLKRTKEEKDRLDGLIETYQENQQDYLLKRTKEENDRLDGLIETYEENQHRQGDLLKEVMEEKDLAKLEENILFALTKYLEKIKVLPAKT